MASLEAAQARLRVWAERLQQQPHLLAVRDGVVGALPLILIGSLFLLLVSPPSEKLAHLLAPYADVLKLPYRMLGGVLAIYVGFSCAYSLASRYKLDPLANSLTAVACYLCTMSPAPLAPPATGWGLPAERLGAGGIFGALLVAIVSVEISRFFANRKWTIRLPGGAPDAIVRSFAALIPTLASVTLIWGVVHGLHIDLVGMTAILARPLVAAGNSLPGAWGVVCLDSGMWLLGLHPAAALSALKPIWLQMLAENMSAVDAGQIPPNLGGHEFFLWFVWQGGSGGTLGLALLLFRCRSTTLKSVGKLAVVPALFNINEPVLFGLPIVLNGSLAIPFLLAPLTTATITWLTMHFGWVARPRLEVLWTLPAPLGAYLTTGGDSRAVVLQLFNLLVTMLIYFPFLWRYDRRLLAKEQAASPSKASAA
jgi:PTS system cellobiose-specific IIC component